MASSIVLRRLAGGSSLLNSLIRPPIRPLSVVPSATRSSNTDSRIAEVEGAGAVEVDRRTDRDLLHSRESPAFFSDVFGPSSTAVGVSQLMNLKDQLLGSPFATVSRGMEIGGKKGWDVKIGNATLHPSTGNPFATLSSLAGEGKTDGDVKEDDDAALHLSSDNKKNILRPLSPHLPVYKPQRSSTLSIFNRISAIILTTAVLLFYVLYLKTGLICFTFVPFYQFFFYSSKLILFSVEVAALALAYHVIMEVRPLLSDFSALVFLKKVARLR
ncbi:Succinate dehydrogenase cytochrome B subunit mitochondrial [Dionaea muscipula]